MYSLDMHREISSFYLMVTFVLRLVLFVSFLNLLFTQILVRSVDDLFLLTLVLRCWAIFLTCLPMLVHTIHDFLIVKKINLLCVVDIFLPCVIFIYKFLSMHLLMMRLYLT